MNARPDEARRFRVLGPEDRAEAASIAEEAFAGNAFYEDVLGFDREAFTAYWDAFTALALGDRFARVLGVDVGGGLGAVVVVAYHGFPGTGGALRFVARLLARNGLRRTSATSDLSPPTIAHAPASRRPARGGSRPLAHGAAPERRAPESVPRWPVSRGPGACRRKGDLHRARRRRQRAAPRLLPETGLSDRPAIPLCGALGGRRGVGTGRTTMLIRRYDSINDVDPGRWDAVSRDPFSEHACLAALERSAMEGVRMRYASIEDRRGNWIAAAPFARIPIDAGLLTHGVFRGIVAGARRVHPGFLHTSLTICGAPLSVGNPPARIARAAMRETAYRLLAGLLLEIAEEDGSPWRAFKELDAADADSAGGTLTSMGWVLAPSEDNHRLAIRWAGFDGYLAAASKRLPLEAPARTRPPRMTRG